MCLPQSVTLPCSHSASSCSSKSAMYCYLPGNERDASSPSGLQQEQQPDSQQQNPSVESAAARKTLSYKEAFWLATMGGAHALGLQVRCAVSTADAIMYSPSIAQQRQQPDSQQQAPSVESAAARKVAVLQEALLACANWRRTCAEAHLHSQRMCSALCGKLQSFLV